MTGDGIDAPTSGHRVRYDPNRDTFEHPDAPIVPYAHGDGVGETVVTETRRLLDAAADDMGRDIHWQQVLAGTAARERDGTPLPEETIATLSRFRIGLLGPLQSGPGGVGTELRRRLGLEAALTPISHLTWVPSPVSSREKIDVVCVRDTTEDAAAGLEYEPGSDGARRLRSALEPDLEAAGIGTGPAGFGVRPITRAATERVVERALEYAFDRDRDRVTVVHQGDRLPASEGGFRDWARAFVESEYGDSVASEARSGEPDAASPSDGLVLADRHTDEVCRELLTRPGDYDVLVAPALAGEHVAAVATEAVGGPGVIPEAAVGDGRLVVAPSHGTRPDDTNPIATIRAGCFLFELLGWDDVVGVVRDALEATLADGVATSDLARRTERFETVTPEAFVDRAIEHVRTRQPASRSGGVRTTPDERAAIKRTIAGVYNTVFEDRIRATDVQLNQLRGEDEEADIYLPEVGINFDYWRRWKPERRLEVLLHELAHVENYEDGHAPAFYDRLVELVEIAEDHRSELETLFGAPIDLEIVKRHVVEAVHEETIEPSLESVTERQRALRRAFGIARDDHY